MAKRNFNETDLTSFLNYAWPTAGVATVTGATKAVSLTTIEATDIVSAQTYSLSTNAYIIGLAITAKTGFVITFNADPGPSTVHYQVFKRNS